MEVIEENYESENGNFFAFWFLDTILQTTDEPKVGSKDGLFKPSFSQDEKISTIRVQEKEKY